jgi:hypothetical protein
MPSQGQHLDGCLRRGFAQTIIDRGKRKRATLREFQNERHQSL